MSGAHELTLAPTPRVAEVPVTEFYYMGAKVGAVRSGALPERFAAVGGRRSVGAALAGLEMVRGSCELVVRVIRLRRGGGPSGPSVGPWRAFGGDGGDDGRLAGSFVARWRETSRRTECDHGAAAKASLARYRGAAGESGVASYHLWEGKPYLVRGKMHPSRGRLGAILTTVPGL